MTPEAAQAATLEKYRGANAGTIVHRVSLDVEDGPLCSSFCHSPFSFE
jgi:hypothetical protein